VNVHFVRDVPGSYCSSSSRRCRSRSLTAQARGADGEVEVSAGHVVVVPAGEPHGFTATGDGSKQVNIHASPRSVTEWLEEETCGR